MKLEKGKISSSQLKYLIAGYLQGALFVTTYIFTESPRSQWLFVLVSFVIFIPFFLMHVKLSNIFPNDNLFQINDKVLGKYIGKAVSFIYFVLFIFLTALNIKFPIIFLKDAFMTDTPLMAFAIAYILLCAFAVKGGIETIARVSIFTVLISLAAAILYFVVLINEIQFKHFLPVINFTPEFIWTNLNAYLCIYMGEIFSFLMILPYVSDKAAIKKNYFFGMALGDLTLLIGVILVTGVMGSVATISSWPIIETTRLIEIQNIAARIEFIFMGVIIVTSFMKSSILYYISLMSAGQLFKLNSYSDFIIPVGLVILGLTMPITENMVTITTAGRDTWPFLAYFIQFMLPLFTLLTALLKGFNKKQGDKS